ncbi:MAG: electron transfer flavoprotein subunit alpha/FixB family protein [Anaerolineales bacterium]|nr:MAG: electron transfer flavoprotein subunit alpha/FixB family protein [Anaerolineales bacterium]
MTSDIYVLIEHLQGQVSEMSYMMLAAGRPLAEASGGNLVAMLLGQDAQELAADLDADRVLYVEHPALAEFSPDAYLRVLTDLIQQGNPRAVLMGETSIGADVAGTLSARLNLPIVSLCRNAYAEGGTLKFVSQIYGGKVLAEGDLPEPTTLMTMVPGDFKAEAGQSATAPEIVPISPPDLEGLKVTHKQFIEPEAGDVDIAKEPILIAVGRGIQQEMNLEIAQELAEALGGELCASRPVVDQGWMTTGRLVGKSGKTVKPKVYLAIGISGAPEHAEGIGDTELFIAINTDEQAPIFDIAKYGAAADLFDLIPAVTEKIKEAKGG